MQGNVVCLTPLVIEDGDSNIISDPNFTEHPTLEDAINYAKECMDLLR